MGRSTVAEPQIGDLVKVTWLDAHGSAANAAYDVAEIPHSAVEVISYGILLKCDDVGISIASEICDKSTFRGYSFVPRSMAVGCECVKAGYRPRVRKVKEAQ